MTEISQCDFSCPRKAFSAAEYREDSGSAGPLRRAVLAGALVIQGVIQMKRASSCPQRDKPAETWRADPNCTAAVSASLAERSLNPEILNDYERGVLAPYLNPEPPANEA